MDANERNERNKQRFYEFWQTLPGQPGEKALETAATLLHEEFSWNGPHPLNHIKGLESFVTHFWQPFRASFPDVQRETHVLLGSEWEDYDWVGATGLFRGTFQRDWLGIPATGKETTVRYGDFWRLQDGKIVECYMLLDIPDVMRQAGYPLLHGYGGAEGVYPPPMTEDGVILATPDSAESKKSLELVEAMIAGLLSYDGENLASMDMPRYWKPDMHWYGPSGIGAARTLTEFEDYHQRPFLQAFPDRTGGDHKARLYEGAYVATTGWPSVIATATGDYLGAPAPNRRIEMRVMDFWRREGDLLAENWVLIDLPDLLLQYNVDVFARLQEQVGKQ